MFDPDTVAPGPLRRVNDFPAGAERLTADQPEGMRHLLVNGTQLIADGELAARRRRRPPRPARQPHRPLRPAFTADPVARWRNRISWEWPARPWSTLPPTFAATRDGLHRLACYVIAPARKARTGRIGLRATGDGFGTPPFADGPRIVVRGAQLVVGDRTAAITTLRAGAALVGIELVADPGVGADLPPFEPDADLAVDAAASLALGDWFAFGDAALARLAVEGASVSEAQLWPEHFDLAVVVTMPGGAGVNVGFSPGDSYSPEPYAYVGPHDRALLDDPFWNAPFGAVRTSSELAGDPAAADAFLAAGLSRLR